jgi:autotransporter translocation and assembly factor TamB
MLQRRAWPAKYLRRALRVIVFVGTMVVGIIALALIASQTPWFKDWLRRFMVREANQYVNGNVSIGSLGGDLFYGIQLGDVSIDVNGEHIVTLKRLEVKYSMAELISKGMTVRQIRLEQPFVVLRHDTAGWNIASLVKRQQQEANRQGPAKPLSLPDIEIVDGRAAIDDRAPSPSYTLPRRIEALNVKAGFAYEPVHYSLTIDALSFAGKAPDLTVSTLTGAFATREDDLNVQKLFVRTADSSLTIGGVVRNYLSTPSLQLTASAPRVSLPELAAVLPPLQGFALHPEFDVKADGPLDRLQLALNTKSEAGTLSGTLTANLQAHDPGARGSVSIEHLNLAPILKSPAQKSDITGHAAIEVVERSAPASASPIDRLRGRLTLDAPSVTTSGYTATNVHATAAMTGRRIGVDGRADAYGARATAKGTIVAAATPGQPTTIDLAGQASHVSLAGLPRQINAPRIATNLNATAYHVTGSFTRTSSVVADVTMGQSNVADGTIVAGTTAHVSLTSVTGRPGVQSLEYAAKGEVRDLNLQRVGEAFQIAALSTPQYDSRINSMFDVKGSGATADRTQIDATGTATDSEVFGGAVPRMDYEAHLANHALRARANGEFQHFDPARLAGNAQLKGSVSGIVDAGIGMADTSAPMTPDAITADGRVTLAKSTVAGLQIDNAFVDGQYANRRGDVRQATVKGPDIDVQASGPIALDQTGQSNVKYHVDTTNLDSLGKLVNQPIAGSATFDGTVTGNATTLSASGSLDASNLAYQNDTALDLNTTYTATLPNLEMAHVRVQAQTRGTFVQIGSVQLNTITATTTYADQTLDFQAHLAEAPNGAARELDATGSVIFHPEHQEIHLPSLALQAQGVRWQTAPGSTAAIQYGKERMQVQGLRLVNGQQSLDVDGSLSLGENPAFDGISVTARQVDVSQLEKLALMNRGFSGTLDAGAKIAGSAKAPDVTGHAAVTNGGFQNFKYQSLTVDGGYTADRITLDAHLVQTPGVELTAKGTVPMSALKGNPPAVSGHIAAASGESVDVRVQSTNIDLGIVQGFTNQLTKVTGTLQADFRVTGSGYDPHLDGYVDIQNGAFGVVQTGTRYAGLTTRIELQPERIRIPRLQILDQHGSPMTIQGDLAVHEGQGGAVNVTVQSNDFKVLDNDLGKLGVDANMRLTGDVRHPRLEGDVKLESARLELDRVLMLFAPTYATEALPDVIPASQTTSDKGADEATRDALQKGREVSAERAPAQNAPPPEAAPTQSGVFANLQLNVHVVAPDDLVVRGTDLRPGGPTAAQVGNVNITVGSDLQVQKNVDGPITLNGTVDTVRGFYEFQGRRFTVQRDGTLTFRGSRQINPDLDVMAERLIPNTGVTARIRVTGTARAPQLALTSDPPLDEADVLSLIIFNRSVNDLGTGERASLADTAGGIASGFLASPLSRSIGKALDVDLFDITTSDPATGETAGGVTLGKQVTDKAFVKFQQQFGQRSFSQFMLEYQLAKFLRLNVEAAPESSGVANLLTERRIERAGVELIFFFSY